MAVNRRISDPKTSPPIPAQRLDEEQFAERYLRATAFGPLLESLLKGILKAKGLEPHNVTYRVKDAASAQRKYSSKKNYSSIDDLTDVLGLRITTYFSDEVDRVASIIESEFAVDAGNSIDKRTTMDPDRFGYISRHYVVTLDPRRGELVEFSAFHDFKFEIQIRSILQHAWAEIEHDLGYKSGAGIPRDAKRRFSMLAGLLELADREFVALRRELLSHESRVREAVKDNHLSVEIDQDSLFAYMRESRRVKDFEDRLVRDLESFLYELGPEYAGSRVEELHELGFRTIAQVDAVLRDEGDAIAEFVVSWFLSTDERRQISGQSAEQRIEETRREGFPEGVALYYLFLYRSSIQPLQRLKRIIKAHGLGHVDAELLHEYAIQARNNNSSRRRE